MSDRIVITRSFLATSVLGCLFLLTYWSNRGELERGMVRSLAFVGIMGGVHSVGYRAYRYQGLHKGLGEGGSATEAESVADPLGRLSDRLASAYRKGFQLALVEQMLVLGLSALVLDGGRLFRVCGIATLVYWTVAMLIVGRRPASPTSFDLVLIRYGSLLLPLLVGGVAYAL